MSLIGLQSPLVAQEFGPVAGDWELTLGGSGSNDKNFDNGAFAASASIGYYFTRALELSVRQAVSYADFGETQWNGSTRLALDFHFDLGRLRPYIGGTVGGVYGDTVQDSGLAGIGAGLKFYALEKTFIFASGEYDWFFRRADRADDAFDEGFFLYSLGIGFNF